ncbi:hypothetical protein DFH94DRAFT_711088 [Russula ochroleuca]|uniref:Uncharacterized protein n=1 Tax=Russula ochroleuca TaxID=152965 RepID=A0A9P5N4L5_9AGAM|nr:hypothetical protein DFH94DRAFT_711088 [Russula ochroleuca]
MPNAISKAGKRLFAPDPDVRRYAAADTAYEQDEYVAEAEDERADRRKRDIPPGLSERDAAILRSVKRRASILDKRFKLCGARFGWTFFIAIVPGVGDALTPALGYIFVVHQARKAKIPRALTRRMILNLAISTTIGLMPGAGAILLASYRANVRNAGLLENFLAMRGERAAAKAAQSATSEETKRDASGDGKDKDDARQGKAGEVAEDKPAAGAVSSTSDGEKEKSPNTDQDDKDKNTTAAAPDSAQVRRLRPARSNLEYFQNRDSRFIEDIEDEDVS